MASVCCRNKFVIVACRFRDCFDFAADVALSVLREQTEHEDHGHQDEGKSDGADENNGDDEFVLGDVDGSNLLLQGGHLVEQVGLAAVACVKISEARSGVGHGLGERDAVHACKKEYDDKKQYEFHLLKRLKSDKVSSAKPERF